MNFLENSKGFYEPGQKLKAIVRLIVTKPEKVNSKEGNSVDPDFSLMRFCDFHRNKLRDSRLREVQVD